MTLPESAESHDQERECFRKLDQLLDFDRFLVRETTGGDYGTDRLVELRVDSRYMSNMTFCVQGKSARNLVQNRDGSHSYEIPLKTINYLLNQPNSILLLYLADSDTMKWAWLGDLLLTARDRGIDVETTEQATLTFRFTRAFDAASQEEIYSTVLKRARVERRTSELLAVAEGADAPVVMIDFATEAVAQVEKLDVDELVSNLRKHGLALAGSGRLALLEELIELVPHQRLASDARLAHVASYTHLLAGRAYRALSLLPRGSVAEAASPEDRQLGVLIRAQAEHAIGLRDRRAYGEALEEARELAPESLLGAQITLENLRNQILRDPSVLLKEAFAEHEAEFDRLRSVLEAGSRAALLAELYCWEFQGYASNARAMKAFGTIALSDKTPWPMSQEERENLFLTSTAGPAQDWGRRGTALLRQIQESGDPLLRAQSVVVTKSVMLQLATMSSGFRAMGLMPSQDEEERELLARSESELRATADSLLQLGCIEMATRALLMTAECLELRGEGEAARATAREALQHACSTDAPALQEQAQKLAEGAFDSTKIEQELAERRRSGSPVLVSEEERDSYAMEMLQVFGVPESRYENVRKGVEAIHICELERASFCRHLRMLEALAHQSTRETLFTIDPNRVCSCELLGHESAIGHPDFRIVVEAFKQTHCAGCDKRSPACEAE